MRALYRNEYGQIVWGASPREIPKFENMTAHELFGRASNRGTFMADLPLIESALGRKVIEEAKSTIWVQIRNGLALFKGNVWDPIIRGGNLADGDYDLILRREK